MLPLTVDVAFGLASGSSGSISSSGHPLSVGRSLDTGMGIWQIPVTSTPTSLVTLSASVKFCSIENEAMHSPHLVAVQLASGWRKHFSYLQGS